MGADHAANAVAVLRAVLESPEDIVIFALDDEYRYLAFNANHSATMKAIWNVDIEVGQCMLDVIGREDDRTKAKANFDRVLAGESFKTVESYGDEALDRRWYEDAYSPIRDDAGEIIGLTVFLTDVTEDRQNREELAIYRSELEALVSARTEELAATQSQLLRAQKLESLGLMAGGIAHDFNNLLVGILGCAELARSELSAAHPAASLMEEVVRAASRASELTAQMLAYAGRSPQRLQVTALSRVIDEQRKLLRAVVPTSIELQFELGDVPSVEVDPSQIQQVVLNLVTNGAEAHSGPGRIVVSVETRHLDAAALSHFAMHHFSTPREFVVLSVADDGAGMSDSTRERIFDPFFSTKDSGRGLGLSSVLGIVRAHGADIAVHSSPRGGTRFEVIFPRADDPGQTIEPERDEDTPSQQSWPEHTALIVDDEAPVRAVVEMMLDQVRVQSLQAVDGVEGIEQLEAHGDRITMVILDLTMPRQGGKRTLEQIRARRPELPVLVISGFDAASEGLDLGEAHLHTRFLAKPFTIRQFHRALEDLLAS